MSSGARLAAFGAAAALTFGLGLAVGGAVGPEPTRDRPTTASTTTAMTSTTMDMGHGGAAHTTAGHEGSGR